jgi:hypothetical protein
MKENNNPLVDKKIEDYLTEFEKINQDTELTLHDYLFRVVISVALTFFMHYNSDILNFIKENI